jgi:hypothetical protein
MQNPFKNLFGKKPTEVTKEPKPKKVSPKDSNEPWVNVINTNFDQGNPNQGFMELDWNQPFIVFLKEHGYTGKNDEEIVDKWFTDLCKNIGQQLDEESKFVANADILPKKRKKS